MSEQIREAERVRRVLDEDRYAAFGHCRFRCAVCPKIKNLTFDSKEERKLHAGVEFYETFHGVKYERMLRDSYDKAFADPWNRTHWQLIIHRIQSHNDSVVHYCSSCVEYWNDLDKRQKVLDLVEERRPLIFDLRLRGEDNSRIDDYLLLMSTET